MLLFVAAAFAGELSLADSGDRLTPAEETALADQVAPLDYNVWIELDDSVPELTAQEQRAKDLRLKHGGLVVLVDPTYRHTSVELAPSVGVRSAWFGAVREAGNPGFKAGSWATGLGAIVKSAVEHRGEPPPTPAKSAWDDDFVKTFAFPVAFVGIVLLAVWKGNSRRTRWRFGGRSHGDSSTADWYSAGNPGYGSSSSDSSWSSSDSGSSSSDSGSSGGDSGGSSGSW